MQEMDPLTLQPLGPHSPPATLAARRLEQDPMPVPAGTVIQQGPQQGPPPAEATDRGPTDMDTTEDGNGDNPAEGVDFNA